LVFSDEYPSFLPCIPWWQFVVTVVRHLCHLAIFEEFHISLQNAGTHAGISLNIMKPVNVCSRIVLYDEFGHRALVKQYIICRRWTFITDLLKMYATAGPITPMILITFSIALICCDIYTRCLATTNYYSCY
jgi:hypothetical protein